MLEYVYTNKDNDMFMNLCSMLNSELNEILSGPVNPIITRANKTDDFSEVILAIKNSNTIGCIAIRPFSKNTAEIKRMYVIPSERKLGTGKALLEKCLILAKERGYSYVVLESNEKLPNAKQLYLKAGFIKIESYGPYASLEETLCMKKSLI